MTNNIILHNQIKENAFRFIVALLFEKAIKSASQNFESEQIKRNSDVKKSEKKCLFTNQKKILVMDDEEMLRDVMRLMLEHLNYDAETSKNGAETIEMYKKAMESKKPFNAVILDLIINDGMGGVETMKQLIEIDPNVKGIVFSGYSEDPVLNNFQRYGFKDAIAKPFSINQLKELLKNVVK